MACLEKPGSGTHSTASRRRGLVPVALLACLGAGFLASACNGSQDDAANPSPDGGAEPAASVIAREDSGAPGDDDPKADCCSCRYAATVAFDAGEGLPCDFDYPAGWDAMLGADPAGPQAVVGQPSCGKPCPGGSGGMGVMIAGKPNRNADTMEEAWRQVMTVAGKATCGDRSVTFFSTPGSDPAGHLGGLRFHVGFQGEPYSGSATFSCPVPGEWRELQQLFIDSFRTNPDTTFGRG